MNAASNPWLNYWETLPEGQLLFAPEAEEFAKKLRAALPLSKSMTVLDYGCGYGSVTRLIAGDVKEIRYWDAAANMMTAAQSNLSQIANAKPWDQTAGRFDLIIVNSVVQYFSPAEFESKLREWRSLVNRGGRLLLADLSLKGHRQRADVISLLKFSLRRGYFLKALRKTLAERKRYDAVANATPLHHVDPQWLESKAAEIGYTMQWLPENLTHFRARKTAVLQPA